MSNRVDFTKEDLARSSLLGVVRGVCAHTLSFPLQVIKIRLQCSQKETKSYRIASAMLRQEGVSTFYKGFAPQLLQTSIKQIWCWPMISGMPFFFQQYRVPDLLQQAFTGLSIGTIEAAISTPLEQTKIQSAAKGSSKFWLKNAYQNGWKGFLTYWCYRSVNWVSFLTAQKYLRDRSYASSEGKPLSFFQLIKISGQVALMVGIATAPFDIANTLKQAQDFSPSQLFNRNRVFILYRGWPLNALGLLIHNVASVSLIEILNRK